ncbi:MAG: hypothetical protein ACKKL4_00710 [Patescibacteria group bacterium]
MNSKIVLIFIAILIIGISSFFIFSEPTNPTRANIISAIEEANYCTFDTDCVVLESKCPFDCYVYVHSNEAERISKLIESFESRCAYGCVAPPEVVCIDSRCTGIFE